MILDSTTKSIEIVLAGAVATSQLPCYVSYADITTSTFVPGSSDTQTNNTSTVTLVSAPAASTQRQIKTITIYNQDTANATLTIRLNRSATLRQLVLITLLPGQTLQYGENAWSVIDSSGNILQSTQVSAAGGDKQIQFNNGGSALGGDADLTWDQSTNTLAVGGSTPSVQVGAILGSPANPPANTVGIFGRQVSGRMMAAQIDPAGLTTSLQPLLARNKVGYWNPAGNATTVPGVFGITAPTVVGTATARNVATTNLATRMRRIGYVSSATAGSLAEARVAVAQFSCGSGSNDGSGFFFVTRWVPSDAATVAGERNFVGLMNSTAAATNVEPNTLTNCVGIAQLSTDATQLYMVHGGTSAQTAVALGTNFPGATLSTVAYELAIFAPNSVANTFYYQVTNITTGQTTSGTINGTAAQVPVSSVLLAPRQWATNNATALAVGFDVCSIYIETDN